MTIEIIVFVGWILQSLRFQLKLHLLQLFHQQSPCRFPCSFHLLILFFLRVISNGNLYPASTPLYQLLLLHREFLYLTLCCVNFFFCNYPFVVHTSYFFGKEFLWRWKVQFFDWILSYEKEIGENQIIKRDISFPFRH